MQETLEMRVSSLGWDDPLEEEMATHPSSLARKISWTEESGRPQSTRSYRVRHGNEVHACVHAHTHTHTHTRFLINCSSSNMGKLKCGKRILR